MDFAHEHTLAELLQFYLDEIESLTGSAIGFFHFLNADQKTLWLQAWSTNTLQHMCKAEGKGLHYGIEQAGIWADAVRKRQPVIHNDYAALPTLMTPVDTPPSWAKCCSILRVNQVDALAQINRRLHLP
jgi:hypothetical protein